MSRSKLCMLSASTLHLDSTDLHLPDTPTNDTTLSSHKNSSTWTQQSFISNSYESPPNSQNLSFQEDLISHFERRLSDLGPRSKYPYLQKLDQQPASSGVSNTSQSVEMLAHARVKEEKRRGKWWKYSHSSSVKDNLLHQQNQQEQQQHQEQGQQQYQQEQQQ